MRAVREILSKNLVFVLYTTTWAKKMSGSSLSTGRSIDEPHPHNLSCDIYITMSSMSTGISAELQLSAAAPAMANGALLVR